jgi:hypothetical protein
MEYQQSTEEVTRVRVRKLFGGAGLVGKDEFVSAALNVAPIGLGGDAVDASWKNFAQSQGGT